jgi:hypothetical protein
MFNHVINAKHLKDYKIWLVFDNGQKGEIDLKEKLKKRKGVFEPLKDISYFKNFKILNDTLSWENGADFAPESLYQLLLQQNLSNCDLEAIEPKQKITNKVKNN